MSYIVFRKYRSILALVAILALPALGTTLTPKEAADLIAARLELEQTKEGFFQGAWKADLGFMGPITSGMVDANQWTGNAAYDVSAQLAGDFILRDVAQRLSLWGQGFTGDETYALVRLSQTSVDPNNNTWRSALKYFFGLPRIYFSSTEEFLEQFDWIDPSTAVLYLGNYAVAAAYVNDVDKDVWRRAVIERLAYVDNDLASFPVLALGVATWSLAQTGPLDETSIVSSYGSKAPYWIGKTLSDLPALLQSNQVPEGEQFAGSFYWRFDHTNGNTGEPASGYTEDTIYSVLGLTAVASLDLSSNEMIPAIDAAKAALLNGIDEAVVYSHLFLESEAKNVFAGEMLQVLWAIDQYEEAVAAAQAPVEEEQDTIE